MCWRLGDINSPELVIKMAKTKYKKYKTNRKGFVAIPFSTQLSLSTLADDTVLSSSLFISAFGEDIFIISVDAHWALRITANELPVEVGFAHGDLTDIEIKENTEAELTDPDDIIAKERARRPVRRVGVFSVGGVTDMVLNDGVKIRTPIKFSVGNDHVLNFWAKNISGATLTTGAFVELNGTLFGRWQR